MYIYRKKDQSHNYSSLVGQGLLPPNRVEDMEIETRLNRKRCEQSQMIMPRFLGITYRRKTNTNTVGRRTLFLRLVDDLLAHPHSRLMVDQIDWTFHKTRLSLVTTHEL